MTLIKKLYQKMNDDYQKHIMDIFIPIALSMFLASGLSFIDSLMLSAYDVNAMAGVGIASQLQMIFGPLFFGVLSGIGIYSAQALGKKDYLKIKQTFGLGFITVVFLGIINYLIIFFFSEQVINFYSDTTTEIGMQALDYVEALLPSRFFWPLSMLFMYQFRAIKVNKVPLYVNTSMLVTNTLINFFLIYGIGPFPELGIVGAAYGTNISIILFVFVYLFIALKTKALFLSTPKVMFGFKLKYAKEVLVKSAPLIIVELAFGFARTLYAKLYFDVSETQFIIDRISTNIAFLLNAVVMATANASGLLMGEALGKGDKENIQKVQKELFKFIKRISIFTIAASAFILPIFIPIFTYGQDVEVDNLYVGIYFLIIVNGIYMAIRVYSSSIVSILRSGGDTIFILIADPFSSYFIGLPLSFIGFYVFGFEIYALKLIWITEIVGKLFFSYYRFRKGHWNRRVV